MASDRQQAKRQIRASATDELELDQALAASLEKQLELARENNRHTEVLQSQEFGRLGQLLGGPTQASLSVAAMVAVISVLAVVVCTVVMLVRPETSSTLERPLTIFAGLVTTSLAYLFGARSTRPR